MEELALGRELITHYCRARHNDWSEDWIRTEFGAERLGTYAGWLDDLVVLCRSHHEGKQDLLTAKFQPRPVGGSGQIVHLRYLACVLRVADILDFDPERTPEVILRHREIAPESVIYWHKDHEISMLKERGRITLSARPRTAKIHRAVETTVDQIDREMQLCRAVADETHFEVCPHRTEPLPHRWQLETSVRRDIQARNNAYEYINGAFRPNTAKLLQLFSGMQLYDEPLVAVREVLQNAFDAVREQIAYERLARPNPADPSLEDTLRTAHRVELRLEAGGGAHWLICSDDGVGMTKAIITDHVLVSGQARRHDVPGPRSRLSRGGVPARALRAVRNRRTELLHTSHTRNLQNTAFT